jgi:cell division protein FtsW
MADDDTQRATGDVTLLFVTLCLLGIGLVMLYSASSIMAEVRYHDSLYFVKRQVIFAIAGLVLLFVVQHVHYSLYRRLVYVILAVSILSLCLVLVPHFGYRVGGARRWLRLGPFSVQPSEFAKLALVMFMAYSLDKKQQRLQEFGVGLVPHAIACGVFVLLIFLQPDLGTAVYFTMLTLVLLFVAGVRLRHLLVSALTVIPFLVLAVTRKSYRWGRVLAFLDPWRDPTAGSFQLLHSLAAFGSGGLLGVGLGAGRQKLFYLPEPHTDFILAVIGEEAGLVGICVILLLYAVLIWRGVHIALRAPDRYGTYLAYGLTLTIGLQALINGAVVMGLVPTKGLPLPFMSYGGSSMCTSFLAVGILLNISSRRRSPGEEAWLRSSAEEDTRRPGAMKVAHPGRSRVTW